MVRVKICGIKTMDDALAAIEAGADLLGFNFYRSSKRYLSPLDCSQISAILDKDYPHIIRVGVFVNATPDEIRAILLQAQLHLAQLHGDESPDWLDALGDFAFKAVRLAVYPGPDWLEAMLQFSRPCKEGHPGLLADAAVPGEYGGTGSVANWSAAAELAQRVPILLAGGLTPENVRAAVEQVRPWGVDTASGVENSPGQKDAGKMKAFVRAARAKIG
jgi:phosphoribosylanthranilate isomerase